MVKVYTDGFDSHSMNTYAYADGTEPWYPFIKDPLDPHYINLIKSGKGMGQAIADLADKARSGSKGTTFALQFMGDEKTLMNNQGFSKEKAERLVASYHKLYAVYFEVLAKLVEQAGKDGYITVAYGLRIDCPALARSIAGSDVTPATVAAEVRSISNAVCQSYGMINSIAARDFMERVWTSKWSGRIQMQALIHDAIYLFVPMELECIEWVNNNLIDCMVNQMEDNIRGSKVILESECDIHYPTWRGQFTLDNNINQSQISEAISEYMASDKYKEAIA